MTEDILREIEKRRNDLQRARPPLRPDVLATDADPWDWFIERDVPTLIDAVRRQNVKQAEHDVMSRLYQDEVNRLSRRDAKLLAEVRALRASVGGWIKTVRLRDDEIQRLKDKVNA